MISWIIIGIVFAIIVCFAVYLFRKNRKDETLEKKGFFGWLIEFLSNIH